LLQIITKLGFILEAFIYFRRMANNDVVVKRWISCCAFTEKYIVVYIVLGTNTCIIFINIIVIGLLRTGG
jgi:hypothetical protein